MSNWYQQERERLFKDFLSSFAAGTDELPRKIPLNLDVYCLLDFTEEKGDSMCDHDFDPEPTWFSDVMATWKCTRCGREITYGVLQ